jgi:hypothetical protein
MRMKSIHLVVIDLFLNVLEKNGGENVDMNGHNGLAKVK